MVGYYSYHIKKVVKLNCTTGISQTLCYKHSAYRGCLKNTYKFKQLHNTKSFTENIFIVVRN